MYVFECALMISCLQRLLLCRGGSGQLCVSVVEGNFRTVMDKSDCICLADANRCLRLGNLVELLQLLSGRDESLVEKHLIINGLFIGNPAQLAR